MPAASNSRYLQYLLIVCIAFIIKACASVQMPSGGDKDETPPMLMRISPNQLSTANRQVKVVILEFNERVAVQKLKERLIITPKPKSDYVPLVKGKEVILTFDEPLESDRTYRFSFRDGLGDENEFNIPENLNIVFSTGAELDTGMIAGRVLLAKNNEPAAQVVVGAIDESTSLDSLLNTPPAYFAQTNEAGIYYISNLPTGKYRIFAFTDVDKNYKYKSRNEGLAYDTMLISVPIDSTDSIPTLRLAYHDITTPFAQGHKAEAGETVLNMTKGLLNLRLINPPKGVYPYLTNEKAVIRGLPQNDDSTRVTVYMQDSSYNDTIITMLLRNHRKADTVATKQYELKPSNGGNLSLDDGLRFTFNDSVVKLDSSAWVYLPDSAKREVKPVYKWNDKRTVLSITGIKAGKKLYLQTTDSSIVTADGRKNEADTLSFNIKQENEGGIINFKVMGEKRPVLVELLNDQGKVMYYKQNVMKGQFRDVDPGTYTVRLVEDQNANGRWDWGHFKQRRQPETVSIYTEKILIKANFEIDEIQLK